jgi:uncharacterized protein with FMN-binding domain
LVLLSSAAIGAVYLAGYLDTRSADAGLASVATSGASTVPAGGISAAPTTAPAVVQAQVAVTAVTQTAATTASSSAKAAPATDVPPTVAPPTPTAKPAPTVTPQPSAKPAPTATTAPSGLRNGTYTGVGDSRRGAIQAAVTVQSGRITNVAITGASTQYPVSWISQLPPEVVATQSSQVDLVSGATYSSLAFQGAVRQAIALAQA